MLLTSGPREMKDSMDAMDARPADEAWSLGLEEGNGMPLPALPEPLGPPDGSMAAVGCRCAYACAARLLVYALVLVIVQ